MNSEANIFGADIGEKALDIPIIKPSGNMTLSVAKPADLAIPLINGEKDVVAGTVLAINIVIIMVIAPMTTIMTP